MKEPITADLIRKALQPLTEISEQRKADFIEFLKTTIFYDEEKHKEIDKKGIYKDVFLNIELNSYLAEILIGFGLNVVHNDNLSKNNVIFTHHRFGRFISEQILFKDEIIKYDTYFSFVAEYQRIILKNKNNNIIFEPPNYNPNQQGRVSGGKKL